jgi:hypothetical protein
MKRLIFVGALALVLATPVAHVATNPFSAITFPIADLGNCASLSDCKTYCDIADNAAACTIWGQAHGLIPKAPPTNPTVTAINQALQNNPGPGGCTTLEQCKTYCSDTTHQAECVAFAKARHFLSADDQKRLDARGERDHEGSTTPRMGGPRPFLKGEGSTTPPWPRPGMGSTTMPHPGDWHGSTTPRGPKPYFYPPHGGTEGPQSYNNHPFSSMSASAVDAFDRGVAWIFLHH